MNEARPFRDELIAAARMAAAEGDVDALIDLVVAAVQSDDLSTVSDILLALRPPDRVDVFEALEPDAQSRLMEALPDEHAADILEELEDEMAAEIASALTPEELAPILDAMETDEAADVLGDLSPEQAESALQAMDDEAEAMARSLMVFGDDTAGGLMTGEYLALNADDTAEASIDRLRALAPDHEVAYYLYVVDDALRLVGVVSLRQIITADPGDRVRSVMDPDAISVAASEDQETAARLMARYDLMALPVVDDQGRLVGVITHDDLVDVLDEENTEDMYHLVGLSTEERLVDPVLESVARRLPWLALNVMLALVALSVLKRFEPLIMIIPVLAVLFPLVTGQGGNVGTQTMTLVVRWIALGEMPPGRLRRVAANEATIAAFNGVAIGMLAAVVAFVVARDTGQASRVALAMTMAMTLNFITGGLMGVFVPNVLRARGFDPAVASGLFVTTTTDALGVAYFMGLSLLLLR
jgi:magnesium transporter